MDVHVYIQKLLRYISFLYRLADLKKLLMEIWIKTASGCETMP